MPPLPRAAHPRGRRKEGPTYRLGRTRQACRPARPLAPSCRLRASPRAFSGLQPKWRPGRNRKEGRKGQNERQEADRQREVHEIEHREQRERMTHAIELTNCYIHMCRRVGLAVPCCCCFLRPSSVAQKVDVTGPSTADRDTLTP